MTMDVLVILDRSGSMQAARADHEGGLRSFITDQQGVAGDLFLTLVQFDGTNPCEVVCDRVPIKDVDPATIQLIPRGDTPLLDAVGKAVAHLSAKQAERPSDQTVVLIITDGQENASKEWTKEKIKARLAELQAAGATVLFLGANIDAFAEAGGIGVSHAYVASFANIPDSVNGLYRNTSRKLASSRSAVAEDATLTSAGTHALFAQALSYTDEDRAEIATGVSSTPTVTGTADAPGTTSTVTSEKQ